MEKLFKAIFHDGNIIWLDALTHEPVKDMLPDSQVSENWSEMQAYPMTDTPQFDGLAFDENSCVVIPMEYNIPWWVYEMYNVAYAIEKQSTDKINFVVYFGPISID